MDDESLKTPAEIGWIPMDQNLLPDKLKFNSSLSFIYPTIFVDGTDTFESEKDAIANLLSVLGSIHAGIAVPDWTLFGLAISYLCDKYDWPKGLDLNDLGDYLTSKF